MEEEDKEAAVSEITPEVEVQIERSPVRCDFRSPDCSAAATDPAASSRIAAAQVCPAAQALVQHPRGPHKPESSRLHEQAKR